MTNDVASELLAQVAALDGCDETELPLLHDTLDVDALEALIDSCGTVDVRFVYAGYQVRVTGDGTVEVSES